MQLTFTRLAETKKDLENLYKPFMIFFLGRILDLASYHHLSSDVIYSMNAKLARRLMKLRASPAVMPLQPVRKSMMNVKQLLEQMWRKIMSKSRSVNNLTPMKHLKPARDLHHAIPHLDSFVGSIGHRCKVENRIPFRAPFRVKQFGADQLPAIDDSLGKDALTFHLAAIEEWIANNLSEWLERHRSDSCTCSELGDLAKMYHRTAAPHYRDDPEAISVMILTILEVWVGCDVSVLSTCDFLRDYDIGVP